MKFLSLVILSSLAFYNVYAVDVSVAPEPTQSTTSGPTPTNGTTTKPTTVTPPTTISPSSSTTVPTTSTAVPTTSTSAPTSSTSAPTKPTPAPTSPTPAPTSSTPAPTKPTPAPSPTPAPTSSTPAPTSPTTVQPTTPPPKPRQGTWQVNTTNNTACILLQMAVSIDVNYTNVSNATEEGQISVPIDANSTGSCGNVNDKKQSIKLTWSLKPNFTDTLEFVFNKTGDKFDLDIINIKLTLDGTYFPNAKDANKTIDIVHQKVNFVTPVKKSYQCKKEQTLPLFVPGNNVTIGSIKISEFQFQAFSNITNKQFADAIDCEPIETPDVVPIAVGCALMALIIIVLIGYLIGRRRNQARGYLSMAEEE